MLEYTPDLIDYRLKSFYDNDGKHLVRGFLLGTKTGDKGWSVSKKTIGENIKAFIGKPFIVSPKKLDPNEHFLVGTSYDDQNEQQKVVTKGEIKDVIGPLSYNDGSDDIYYDFQAEITDKKVSDALVTGRLPFATSPYIWPTVDGIPIPLAEVKSINKVGVENWVPVHEALVTRGTFGDISVIGKQCLGPEKQCTVALAGSSEDVAEFLSSQIELVKVSPISNMNNSNEQTQIPSDVKVNEQVPNAAPVQVPETKVEEKKTEVSAEQFQELQKSLAEKEKLYNKLLIKDRERELESIFTSFPDAETKSKVMKKWVAFDDVDTFKDFAADLIAYGGLKKVTPKEDKNVLAGNAESKETFPLTGNSNASSNRLHRNESLTELLGGPI